MCGVYVPHACAHGISSTLQCPREQSELSSEVFFIKTFRVRGQPVQVLTESPQSVLTMAVDHMTEGRIHHRHVLRQEEVFHLDNTGEPP